MQSKQEENFVKQITENQRLIHKVCRIYTDNEVDHEDLFQEITLQLWKSFRDTEVKQNSLHGCIV